MTFLIIIGAWVLILVIWKWISLKKDDDIDQYL